jgi:hypothetical protein
MEVAVKPLAKGLEANHRLLSVAHGMRQLLRLRKLPRTFRQLSPKYRARAHIRHSSEEKAKQAIRGIAIGRASHLPSL